MIPTLGFLEAVDKAGAFTTDWNTQDHDAIRDLVGTLMKGKLPTTGETQHALYSDRPSVAEMRFNAVFNPEECDLLAQGHPIEGATPETSRLTSYKDAMAWCDEPYSPGKLLPYGIEGTSPTTPKLHVVGFAAANADLMTAIKDECAFAMAAPSGAVATRCSTRACTATASTRSLWRFRCIATTRCARTRRCARRAANQFVFGAPERGNAATKFTTSATSSQAPTASGRSTGCRLRARRRMRFTVASTCSHPFFASTRTFRRTSTMPASTPSSTWCHDATRSTSGRAAVQEHPLLDHLPSSAAHRARLAW